MLNFTETFTGLRDGIADSGFVVPAYHRAELPYANLLSDMGTAWLLIRLRWQGRE